MSERWSSSADWIAISCRGESLARPLVGVRFIEPEKKGVINHAPTKPDNRRGEGTSPNRIGNLIRNNVMPEKTLQYTKIKINYGYEKFKAKATKIECI